MKKEDHDKLKQIMNTVHDANTYVFLEPKRENRWIVEIPELKIDAYLFQSVHAPTITRTKSTWGTYSKAVIEPVRFSLIETIHTNHYGVFVENIRDNKTLTVWIKHLDPTGVEVTKILLEKCVIIEVSQTPLCYEKDGILKTFVMVKPHSVKFSK